MRAEVFRAATRLCAQETINATFRIDEMRACVTQTTQATFAQASDPSLKLAQR